MSNIGKILETVDHSKHIILSHGNSRIKRKTTTQEKLFKKKLDDKYLYVFCRIKSKFTDSIENYD